MPSSLHETLVELFRARPSLAVELLEGAPGIELPAHEQVRLEPADLPDLVPVELRADTIVALTNGERRVQALIVEIQLNRDADKQRTWPAYVANLRQRLRCPVDLLVFCPDDAVARWCRRPMPLGLSGSTVVPIVVGTAEVPVVTAATEVPEVVVLSALAHGGDPGHREVLDVLTRVIGSVERDHGLLYLGVVHAVLPELARRYLEGLMSAIPFDLADSSLGQWLVEVGVERGKASSVVAFLEARGVAVPEEARARITECKDMAQLDEWVRRAATAGSVDELFA